MMNDGHHCHEECAARKFEESNFCKINNNNQVTVPIGTYLTQKVTWKSKSILILQMR